MENIACLDKTMSLHNKQHLRNISGSIIKTLSNIGTELKKKVAHKKSMHCGCKDSGPLCWKLKTLW